MGQSPPFPCGGISAYGLYSCVETSMVQLVLVSETGSRNISQHCPGGRGERHRSSLEIRDR